MACCWRPTTASPACEGAGQTGFLAVCVRSRWVFGHMPRKHVCLHYAGTNAGRAWTLYGLLLLLCTGAFACNAFLSALEMCAPCEQALLCWQLCLLSTHIAFCCTTHASTFDYQVAYPPSKCVLLRLYAVIAPYYSSRIDQFGGKKAAEPHSTRSLDSVWDGG